MYIGNTPAENYASFLTETFTVSATASYTLSHAVANENDIRLVINGVVQQPGSGKAYTASGTTLTLTSATASGDVMYCVYLGRALQTVNPPNASVGSAQIADDLISGKTALASEPADTDEFLVSDSGTIKRIDYSLIKSSPAFESQLLHVRDEKSEGTNGGTFTNGAWRTRTLNTSKTNEITGASLGSNQITLPSGTYFINAQAPAYKTSGHKAKLYNITDTSDIILGSSEHSWNDSNITTHSFVRGRFTIAAQKVIELQHRGGQTAADTGFGTSVSLNGVEVYAEVMIWKVA